MARDDHIVVTDHDPTLICAHDTCEIIKSTATEMISLAIIGSEYTIERQLPDGTIPEQPVSTSSTSSPPIVEKVETVPTSSNQWLRDFFEDYNFYLIIGGGALSLLVLIIVTIAICKKCGQKSGGYGELGPDESVIEDEDDISEV